MNIEVVKSATKKIIQDKKYYLFPLIPFIFLIFVFLDNTYYNKKNPIKGFLLAIVINTLVFLFIYAILTH